MPKKNSGQSTDKAKRPKSNKPTTGPVPIKKVPSLRGQHSVGLHAAGSFLKAPSPGALPKPPIKWMASNAGAPATSTSAAPPPAVLNNAPHVVAELQGNLLHLTLSPRFPELAGKITGMLLELGPEEVAEILGNEPLREEAIQSSLRLLRDAGDERAVRALQAPMPPPQPKPLTIDIGAAQAAQAAAETGNGVTGLTPALACSGLRMSPRVSTCPFFTANILAGSRN